MNAKIEIIRKTAKFRAYPKIGIPLKIPTCKYNVSITDLSLASFQLAKQQTS